MIFSSGQTWPLLILALALLAPLAWYAWSRPDLHQRQKLLPLTLRLVGILLVAFALVDPLLTEKRPSKGANLIALLADDSQGLRIKDPAEILDRGERARKYLSGSETAWKDKLSNTYQLRNYRFDHALHRVGDFDTLTFEGGYSEIGSNLLSLSERLNGKPLAGIVLFSDGVATDSPLSDDQLATLPPIYPVVLGSRTPIRDLALSDLKVEQSAFADSPLVLNATAKQSFGDGTLVNARLSQFAKEHTTPASRSRKTLIEEQSDEFDATETMSFEWQTEGGGIQFFELNLEQQNTADSAGEAILDNNRRMFAVDKGKSEYRILYVTGRPNWEYKFLNRSLSEDPRLSIVGLIRVATKEPNFEFKGRAGENSNSLYRGFGREDENERYDEAVLIRMNTRDEKELVTGFPSEPEELFTYDAVVIDDLEADFFSFTQQTLIRDFVKQRGGGLLLLGGVNAFQDGGYANTPIAQALPIYLNQSAQNDSSRPPVFWELTRNGWVEPWTRIRPVDSDERFRIQDMPQFLVYNKFERIRPGAEALVSIQVPGSENHPALVTRKFGSGRVAAFAVGDLWRWGLKNAGTQADLAQFWRQLSRWLVTDTPEQVQLSATTSNAREIQLSAKAFDEEYKPLQLGEAKVTIRNLSNEGPERTIEMDTVPERPGSFSARFTAIAEGAYLARLEVLKPDGEVVGFAETGWVTQPLVEEFESIVPDYQYLARIAEKTGGQLLEFADLNKLEQLITERPNPLMETHSVQAWHNNFLYLLALGAFLGEWLLRRKRGLA